MKKYFILLIFIWAGLYSRLFAQSRVPDFQQLDSGTDRTLNDIFCISPDTVVAVGDSIILRTMDGGNQWDSLALPVYDYFRKVRFADTSIGYVIGDHYVLKTTDGGRHWHTVMDSVMTGRTTYLGPNISLLGTDSIFVIRTDTTVLMSSDGGINWQFLQVPDSAKIYTMQFINSSTGFLTAETFSHSYLLRTENAGQTWQLLDTLPANTHGPKEMDIISFDTIYISHFSGILKTTDGGHHWREIMLDSIGMPYNGNALSTVLPSSRQIWSVGFLPLICTEYPIFIFHNPNGGDDYHHVELYEENNIDNYGRTNMFNSIHFADTLTGYVVGRNGKILKISDGTIFNVPEHILKLFSVYPNPVSHILHIDFPANESSDFALADNTGKIIRPFSPLTKHDLDIHRLKPGPYMLLIRYKGQIFGIRILVKNST